MEETASKPRTKAIFTCFAGRRRNMEILLRYADDLKSRGLIEQMHIWDFARDSRDSAWLSKTFQKSPFMSTKGYDYVPTGESLRPGETREIMLKCGSDAHLLMIDARKRKVAEICLGAYNNSCDFLRDAPQGKTITSHGGNTCDPNRWRRLGLRVGGDGTTTVQADGEAILSGRLASIPEFPLSLSLAGWNGADEVRWRLSDEDKAGFTHPYARLFAVKNKGSWLEYYRHYTSQLYPGSVIIKSDDDIVFLDVESFGRFVEQKASDKESLLLFPSIVNNGLCAFHQQSMGYIDEKMGRFPHEGAMGRLWGDGRLCFDLHRHFCDNHGTWINKSRSENNTIKISIGERISINFFAIRSEDLHVFQMVGGDDERDITTVVTKKLGRPNLISMGMTVAHLAFYKQRQTGLNEAAALEMYRMLAEDFLSTGRNKPNPKGVEFSRGNRIKML